MIRELHALILHAGGDVTGVFDELFQPFQRPAVLGRHHAETDRIAVHELVFIDQLIQIVLHAVERAVCAADI